MAAAPGVDAFSLTNCGPVDRALAHVGLQSCEPPQLLVRAFAPAVVIWLPLLALALLRPHDGAEAAVSFFEDLATHVRFLVVVPLLVLAEASIGRRTGIVVAQFVNAELIASRDRARFDSLIRRAGQALQSNLAEVTIAVVAALAVVAAFRTLAGDGVTFWFEQSAGAGQSRLTAAGWWYALWSWLPPFLLLRWVWRYLVWCWLLQRLSRFDLQIVATHPDRAAGLAFVSLGHTAFTGVGLAMSCLVAAAIGTRVLQEGVALAAFKWPLAVFIALAIVVGMAPLAVFWRPLRIAKEAGLLEYGSFSSRYVQGFHRKWIATKAGERPLEANEDIGPLADIGASFERVDGMRLLPITLKTALAFAVPPILPMLPLLLTEIPLRELLKILMHAMI
jgi:hypothetical protein